MSNNRIVTNNETKIYGIITIILICTSCITTTSSMMKSWVGHSETELLIRWGAPDLVQNLPSGEKVYTWKRFYENNQTLNVGRQSFVIDQNGIVEGWSYENIPWLTRKY